MLVCLQTPERTFVSYRASRTVIFRCQRTTPPLHDACRLRWMCWCQISEMRTPPRHLDISSKWLHSSDSTSNYRLRMWVIDYIILVEYDIGNTSRKGLLFWRRIWIKSLRSLLRERERYWSHVFLWWWFFNWMMLVKSLYFLLYQWRGMSNFHLPVHRRCVETFRSYLIFDLLQGI